MSVVEANLPDEPLGAIAFLPPLRATRVLDMTAMWSGPYCTRVLADLGADVVKVEAPFRLDGLRTRPTTFAELNHTKRSLLLDLRVDADRELFLRLVGAADVLVENYSPRVLRNFGLAYDTLSATNPSVIALSMPAFGGSGPQQDWIGFGFELEAFAGLSSLTRDAAGAPVPTGIPYADPTAGIFGALAVLAALWRRHRDGRGCHIDLSQREAMMQFLGESFAGLSKGPGTAEDGDFAGCFPCRDGRWVALSIRDDADWNRLVTALGRGELANDAGYASAAARRARRADVDRLIRGFTEARSAEEVVTCLRGASLPAAAVAREDDIDHEPLLEAAGFWRTLPDGALVSSRPWRASLLPRRDAHPAPAPDADRESVLEQWLR